MAEEREAIDISGIPELLRIVERVQLSRQPQVLRRDSEVVALVVPVPAKASRSGGGAADHAAVLATAGSWKDLVDADALKDQLSAERGSDRSPATL